MQNENNRIKEALLFSGEQEIKYRINNAIPQGKDLHAAQTKLKHYQELVRAYKSKLSPDERATRKFIRNEIKKLWVATRPTVLNYIRYGAVRRTVVNFLLNRRATIQQQSYAVNNRLDQINRQYNTLKLKDTIKKVGFHSDFDTQLDKMMAQGLKSFPLRHNEPRYPGMEFILHFSKIPGTESYQLERLEAISQQAIRQAMTQKETAQWLNVPLDGPKLFTAQEATILSNGQSIKAGDHSHEWIIFDKTTNGLQQVYFNEEKALQQQGILLTDPEQLPKVMQDLKHNGQAEAVVTINGQPELIHLSAHPLSQTIHLRDAQGKWMDPHRLQQSHQPLPDNVLKIVHFNHSPQEQQALSLSRKH